MNKDSLIEKDGIVKTATEWNIPTEVVEAIPEVSEDKEGSEEETSKKKIVKIKKS